MSVGHSIGSRIRFGAASAVFFVLLAGMQYWPVLAGHTPFPSQKLLGFPMWQDAFQIWTVDPQPENGDLITLVYPYREFAGRTLRSGEVPLWNPHQFMGTPFQADLLSSLLAPAAVLHVLLPSWLAWGLGFWLRSVLAGTFTAWLLRWLGASRAGALVAGIAYAFGGYVLAWQGFQQSDTAVWLPATFAALARLREKRRARDIAVAAVAFALPVLSGHPSTAVYVCAAAVAFGIHLTLIQFPEDANGARRRFTLQAVAASVLALALAAVQMLPSLEWVWQTHRGSVKSNVGQWRLPIEGVVSFLCRDALTSPNTAGILVPEAVTYSGALTVVAAFLAALYTRRRHAVFFALLLLLALQVVYGWGPMFWISSRAPGLSAFNNWRVIVVACFALSVLAGLGTSAVQARARVKGPSARVCWLVLGLAVMACAAGVWWLRIQTIQGGRVPSDRWHAPSGTAALILISAALLTPLAVRRLSVPAWSAGVVTLTAADLLSFGYGYVPFARREHVFPAARALSVLDRDPGVYRVASLVLAMPWNAEMVYSLDSPTGYGYPLHRTVEMLTPITEGASAPALQADRLLPARHRILDLLNVKYLLVSTWAAGELAGLRAQPQRFEEVLAEGHAVVFRNTRALPRAFLVGAEGVEVIRDDGPALSRLRSPEFDPERSVTVSEPPSWTTDHDAAGELEPVRLTPQGVNVALMETSAPRRTVLVYSDTWYPGWQVFVDGAQRPLLRVNHAFKGVALEPGRHNVRFEFAPWRFRWGAVVSIAGALAALALAIPWRRRASEALEA